MLLRAMSAWLREPVRGVLLDITGVLYESGVGDGTVIPGSVEAVSRLREAGLGVRLVTNESSTSPSTLVEKLRRLGFTISEKEIFSPIPAAVALMKQRGLVPHLLVGPEVEGEFSGLGEGPPGCVVLGDAEDGFSFANMTAAFRALKTMPHPTLISLGYGKYYKHKGDLQLDVGAFAKALEFACDVESEVVGKPSPVFFKAALDDLGVSPAEAVMVGDDIVSDVGGAQKCGLRGVLVRTGKFTPACESHPTITPHHIADNLAHIVDQILEANRT